MGGHGVVDHRRLFFALWPSDILRARIEAETHVTARQSGGRVIPARSFHVTVLFLGEVPIADFDLVRRAAEGVAAPPFELTFDRVDAWPGSNVLCLTAAGTPPALKQLVEQLRAGVRAQWLKPDKQEFRPHITLARNLSQRRVSQGMAALRWKVSDFALVESVPGRGGSAYSVLERWPLSQ